MNLNRELLQFYIYKKVIKKKQEQQILDDCKTLGVSVREYMVTKGYVSEEKANESVSRTLEFALDDYCIAQMAKALGHKQDYKDLTQA